MRVLCIKEFRTHDKRLKDTPQPEIGDEDIVIDQKTEFGKLFYRLDRFPDYGFAARCFATLPEATATEMYETEIEGILF